MPDSLAPIMEVNFYVSIAAMYFCIHKVGFNSIMHRISEFGKFILIFLILYQIYVLKHHITAVFVLQITVWKSH